MKYIKRFERNQSIKDYCEVNLAYLMDDGLKIELESYKSELAVELNWGGYTRTWLEIKDHIIPFLRRIRNDYKLEEIFFGNDPKTAESQNNSFSDKWVRFSVPVRPRNGIGVNKEINLSYDEIESFSEKETIEKIIFWIKQ